MSIYPQLVLVADQLDNDIDPTARTGFDKVQISAILIGVVLPLVVGLVTKRYTSPTVKAVLLLAASALTAFITEWANSANFVWQQALLTMILTFGTGVVAHLGLWRPTGVTDKAQSAFGGDRPKAA
jgi:hypothetical protein